MPSPQGFLDSPPVSHQPLGAGSSWGREEGTWPQVARCTRGWAKG